MRATRLASDAESSSLQTPASVSTATAALVPTLAALLFSLLVTLLRLLLLLLLLLLLMMMMEEDGLVTLAVGLEGAQRPRALILKLITRGSFLAAASMLANAAAAS